MFEAGTILLDDTLTPGGSSLLFTGPRKVIRAFSAAEAEAALRRAEEAGAEGLWAAGYLAYELGHAFEERLHRFLPENSARPLLWLGLYAEPERLTAAEVLALLQQATAGATASVTNLRYSRDFAEYRRGFEAVEDYIAAGDVYQVNLTFKARFQVQGDALALYRDLALKQPVAYGAYMHAEDHQVLSRSPELFVESRSGQISARPMKGTLGRGRTLEEDEAGRKALAADYKSRAENLMIVDLLRNDIGRIAEMGSVKVTDLFSVETYRSLHQMTSGITARQKAGLSVGEIVRALFPCGSVTGAPKIRAMEIINAVEGDPRGVYTGAIGYIAPNKDFCFSVGIRTAVIGRDGTGEIGIGGGIVADSEARPEYEEALLKMKFFADPADPIALIETLLWEPGAGYWLLERHLDRLAASALYFQLPLAEGAARLALEDAAAGFGGARMRVRLLHEAEGLSVTATPLPQTTGAGGFRFMLAEERTDSANPFVWHKTTRRDFLDAPRKSAAERFGVDEVVFLNERDELTEGSFTSLFLEKDGILLTPHQASGLLPGTLRAELLATGKARESVLRVLDLKAADAIYLGNSVRGLMRAEWLRQPE